MLGTVSFETGIHTHAGIATQKGFVCSAIDRPRRRPMNLPRTRYRLFVGLVLLVVTGTLTPVASATASGAVSGRVSDAATGVGLIGITVELRNASGNFATSGITDSNGDYVTSGDLPTGTYFAIAFNSLDNSGYIIERYDDIVCTAYCDAAVGKPIAVTQGVTTTGIDFSLAKGQVISGVVTDAATGAGLGSVRIEILTANESWISNANTAPDGSFTSNFGLPAGTYFAHTLNVPGFVDQVYNGIDCAPHCIVVRGSPIVVPSGPGEVTGINFNLVRGGAISGSVTDVNTQSGLSGITVQAIDTNNSLVASATSSSDGTYLIEGIPAGLYQVATHNESRNYADELNDGSRYVDFCDRSSGSPVTVATDATTTGIDFALTPTNDATGTLSDDFNAGAIDQNIWDRTTFVRRLDAGALLTKLTQRGSKGGDTTSFANPDDPLSTGVPDQLARSIAADVRVDEVCNNGAHARARVTGFFYNDGTAGGGETGEVLAAISLRHNGKDLEVSYNLSRCLDWACNQWQDFVFERTTFGPAIIGQTHRLSIDFDGAIFTFKFDGQTALVDARMFSSAIIPSQYFKRTGSRHLGVGTRTVRVSGPHEGAYLMAHFDNVVVDGQSYDDFSGTHIDPSRWHTVEFGREIEQGRFRFSLSRRGSNDSNDLHFQNPDVVTSYEADVTVTHVHNVNAFARAQVTGYFYNDGTSGSDQAGEVQANIEIRDDGSALRPTFFVRRCDDDPCNQYTTFVFDDSTFGTVSLGETHRLGIHFESGKFTFRFDNQVEVFDAARFAPLAQPTQYHLRTGNRFKGISTRISGIDGPEEEAHIVAMFDNVVAPATINTDPDNDGKPTADDNCPTDANALQTDGDGDGVGDACDAFLGDSRGALDSDRDAMADEWEVVHGLDPSDDADALGDTDNDGLSNVDEFIFRTSLYDADTDGDGTGDIGDNCPTHSNPGQSDFDGDGAGNVCDLDDDGDGIPDAFEIVNNLDPLDPVDASGDLDGDGFTNLQEFKTGTDPNDRGSNAATVFLPILQMLFEK
jgi:hypothetical protein